MGKMKGNRLNTAANVGGLITGRQQPNGLLFNRTPSRPSSPVPS